MEELKKADIPTLEQELLSKSLKMVKEEKIQVPIKMQKELLERATKPWISEGIKQGSQASSRLKRLAEVALLKFGDADLVEMTFATAREYEEQMTVWQGIVALLSNPPVLDLKASIASLGQKHLFGGSLHLVKVAVNKLDSAKAKAVTGSLTLIATNIEASDWFRVQLHRYMLELPLLEEWYPKLVQHKAKLAHVADNLNTVSSDEALQVFENVGRELQQMKASVRAVLMEDFQDLFLDTLHQFAESVISTASEQPLEICVALQKVYAELGILFPSDSQILSRNSQLASVIGKLKKSVASMEVAQWLEKLLACLSGAEVVETDVFDIMGKVQSVVSSLPPGNAPPLEKTITMVQAWSAILAYFAENFWVASSYKECKKEGYMATLSQLPTKLGFPSSDIGTFFKCFDATFQLRQKYVQVVPSADAKAEDILEQANGVELVNSLKRAVMMVENTFKTVDALVEIPDIITKGLNVCKGLLKVASMIAQAILERLMTVSIETLGVAFEALKGVSGGCPEGKHWSESVSNKDQWDGIEKKFKNGTLITVQPDDLDLGANMWFVLKWLDALLDHGKELSQVCYMPLLVEAHDKYLAASAIKGDVVASALSESVKKHVALARATKAEACLMDIIAKKDPAIRKHIQEELKELRLQLGEKKAEEKALHGLVLARFQKVLKGEA
eukprot:1876963-Amphidinium_carterae.6